MAYCALQRRERVTDVFQIGDFPSRVGVRFGRACGSAHVLREVGGRYQNVISRTVSFCKISSTRSRRVVLLRSGRPAAYWSTRPYDFGQSSS